MGSSQTKIEKEGDYIVVYEYYCKKRKEIGRYLLPEEVIQRSAALTNKEKLNNAQHSIESYEQALKKYGDASWSEHARQHIRSNNILVAKLRAATLNDQGKSLIEEYWLAETNEDEVDRSDEAAQKIKEATTKFKEALRLDPENVEYKQNLHFATLKIEGNTHFNDMVELQQEAKNLKDMGKDKEASAKHEAAIAKGKEAIKTFEKGLKYDSRLETSVTMVRENLEQSEIAVQIAAKNLEEGVKGTPSSYLSKYTNTTEMINDDDEINQHNCNIELIAQIDG